MRIAAVGDVHCTNRSQGKLRPIFQAMAEEADVILLCGDLTLHGTVDEASVLGEELARLKVPRLAVLGNHDLESGHADRVRDTLSRAGVTILDGDSRVIQGVGFAGVKGFCGGFSDHALEAWGEPRLKDLMNETLREEQKLDAALAKLQGMPRVAMLHYSPIRATVEGEPLEILPFLGSHRLERPLDHHEVRFAFHGHAHHGTPEGKTRNGTQVYNVAMPLLRRNFPNHLPYRLVSIDD